MEKKEATKLIQKLELELNDLETIEKSIILLPEVLSNNIQRVSNIRKAMEFLDADEKKLIKRTCIDGVSPRGLELEFNCSYRKIYLDKEKALKKLTRLMYGLELWEEDNEKRR